MIAKHPLCPERLRRPPPQGFSWIDRRFLRVHAKRLSAEAIFLYLFLAAVSDQFGLSCYSDANNAAAEATARQERALGRRIKRAHLPKQKTLQEYDFSFPKRIPKQAILSRRAGIRLRLHQAAGLRRFGGQDRNRQEPPLDRPGV